MYCEKCGAEVPDGARFCPKCGAPVTEEVPTLEEVDTPRRKTLWIKILIVVILCAAALFAGLFARHRVRQNQFQNHLETGLVCMADEDYEEAAAEFSDAIQIDSRVVEPYIYLADAYDELDAPGSVEDTYNAARTMILSSYDRSEELPDNSTQLYLDAIYYYEEQNDPDTVEELKDEILPILPEGDEGDEISRILTSSATEEEPYDWDVPDEESVIPLLSLFYAPLGESETAVEYEKVDPATVYTYAGCSLARNALQDISTTDLYYYIDGDMVSQDSISETDRQTSGDGYSYAPLPAELYEDYIQTMFGSGYSLYEFVWKDDVQQVIREDAGGNFYLAIGEGETQEFDTIELAAMDPDANNTYAVLAVYDSPLDPGNPEFLLFWLAPDEDSAYGYVVAGLMSAGEGAARAEVLDYFNSLGITQKATESDSASYDLSGKTADEAYQKVLDELREAVNLDTASYQADPDYYDELYANVAEYIDYPYPNFYYTYYDINSDRQNELLIGIEKNDGMGIYCFSGFCTYDGDKALGPFINTGVTRNSGILLYENGAVILSSIQGVHADGGQAMTGEIWTYDYYKIADDGYTLTKESTWETERDNSSDSVTYRSEGQTVSESEFNSHDSAFTDGSAEVDYFEFDWIPL